MVLGRSRRALQDAIALDPPATPQRTEATMHKVRVNLANPVELQQLPGIEPPQVEAIVKFRREHGPIRDATQLASIIGGTPKAEALAPLADFAPSGDTSPEAPGA